MKQEDIYTFVIMDTIGSRKSDAKLEEYLKSLDNKEAQDTLSKKKIYGSLFDSFIREKAKMLTPLLNDLNVIKGDIRILAGDEVHVACNHKELLTLIKYLKLHFFPLNFRIGISIGIKYYDLYLKHMEFCKGFVKAMREFKPIPSCVSYEEELKVLDYHPCEMKIEKRTYKTLKLIKEEFKDERLIYINQEDNRSTRYLNSILNELNNLYYQTLIDYPCKKLDMSMFETKDISNLEEKFENHLDKFICKLK